MLIEESELRLGLVGLGHLTEFAAMTLFADAQAHAITAGTGGTLRDIVDVGGARLYPGYFWTRLTVPPTRLLARHRIWDKVAVGVDVRAFGPVLSSRYVLGSPAELASASEVATNAVTMSAASMFVVDGASGEAQPARPKQGTIATLPKADAAPPAIATFREVRASGAIAPPIDGPLHARTEVEIVGGRDASAGHDMMFAQFVRVFDLGERALLRELRPPIHGELVEYLEVLDREIYYIDNCGAGARVAVDARGRVSRCPPDLAGDPDAIAAAIVELALSAHDAAAGRLLALAHVKKLLVIPKSRPALVHDAERFVRQHGAA